MARPPRKLSMMERLTGRSTPPAYGRPEVQSAYLRDVVSPFIFGWQAVTREPMLDTMEAWQSATSKAVDASHNSGWLSGGLVTAKAQMIGNGLALNMRPDPKIFGGDLNATEEWARDVEVRFEQWSRDPWSCDRGGRYTLGQMAGQITDQYFVTGEGVAILPFVERPGSTHGTKVEVLPSMRLAQNVQSRPEAVQGIELDRDGAPVAYWFDPPARPRPAIPSQQTRVAGRDRYGRPVVLHVLDGPPTAVRGITPIAPVLKVMRQYDQFADATLTAALIQTIFAASLESDAPTADVMKALQSEDEQDADELQAGAFDDYMEKRFKWYDRAKIDIGKFGKIVHTFLGEKLVFHRSEHPNTGYVDFSKGLLREIARCLGVTYEQLTGDYVGATYSSVRMAIADMWLINLNRRAHIPGKFYQGVFEAWLEEDIELGNTPFPGGVDAYLAQRQFVARCDWRGPPRPTADDLKTAKAQQIQRQEGWVPTEQLANEYGNDHRDVIESQKRTNDLRDENDLPPLLDPGTPKPLPPGAKPPGAPGPNGPNNGDQQGRGAQDDPNADARRVGAMIRGEDPEPV